MIERMHLGGDLLPCLEGVNAVYADMGFKYNPVCGRMVAPTLQTPLDRSLSSLKDEAGKAFPATPTPLQRSLSSLKEVPETQTPLQRSLSSFKEASERPMPMQRSYTSSFQDASA